ncbi:MAG: sugar phosphorylase [Elusimicrobia bacterium]|nr:sugar phosphorylase [Elusimicrobiota bacterium]
MSFKSLAHKIEQFFPDEKEYVIKKLFSKIKNRNFKKFRKKPLTQKDSVLIVYGDNFIKKGEKPLKTLLRFLDTYAKDGINRAHILPFFPYSSDDGFSVIDYRKTDKKLGSWKDIEKISKKFPLMFDFVLNHISSKSAWFKKYLNNEKKFSGYFISRSPKEDLSAVVRPRSHPLLTPFSKKGSNKKEYLWTTFSADQIDINFENPDVFIEMTDIFLFYALKGAAIMRLDAIAYLWKEAQTKCIHHEKTHLYVKFLRDIVDTLGLNTIILTETNVPHNENISYFGKRDEAHMVYQFALPPLLAHAMMRENSVHLNKWAKTLSKSAKDNIFFNFTASHDGIGIRPLSGILKNSEIEFMKKKTIERGGAISYKKNSDGSQSPYELNIMYMNLMNSPQSSIEEKASRFMASQAIMLSMKGVPGIYVHSFIGSENFIRGVQKIGMNRAINREKLEFGKFEKEINCEGHIRKIIHGRYLKLLKIRAREKAFSPYASQRVINLGESFFALLRGENKSRILCIVNLSATPKRIKGNLRNYIGARVAKDIISNRIITEKNPVLKPFKILWLKQSYFAKATKDKRGSLVANSGDPPKMSV